MSSDNPLTKPQARELAAAWLAKRETAELKLALLDDVTEDRVLGWAFFYQSTTYLETRDMGDALVGNGPVYVNMYDGSTEQIHSGLYIEHIYSYERKWIASNGDRYGVFLPPSWYEADEE